MDEFAGLDKGWNDPDMLMIGMNGLNDTMCKTHMTMWCMINSPLMLGMDLRNVEKDSEIFKIISNTAVIALNQDSLGIQAKRIYTTKAVAPDTTYIRDNDRIDVLAKPLADGSVALSFINVSTADRGADVEISVELIKEYIGSKMAGADAFAGAESYEATDVWTGETKTVAGHTFNLKDFVKGPLKAYDNVTLRIKPVK